MKYNQEHYQISLSGSTTILHVIRESLKNENYIMPSQDQSILSVGYTSTTLHINIMADDMPVNYFRKLAKMYKVPFAVYCENELVRYYNRGYGND